MPRSKKECERIREQTKSRIISAAIEVFAKKGYAAASTSEIAKAANISDGLLYRYFSSKQDLFKSITDNAVGGLDGMTQLLSSGGNPKETITTICREILSDIDNEEFINLNMMVIQGIVSENNSVFQTIMQHDKHMFDAAANLIQRGQDSGAFASGDPVAKSTLLFSSIQGLVMMKFLFKDNFITPSLAEMTAFLYQEATE